MKFFCDKSNISTTISNIAKIVPSKSAFPAYEGILIEAKGDSCKMTGGNGHIQIEEAFNADVKEEGIAFVPGRLFHDIIRKCYDGDISITIDEKQMTIISGEMVASIGVLNADIFPTISLDNKIFSFTMENMDFKDGVRKSSFCALEDNAATNILQTILTCVYICKEGERISFKSVNGSVMADIYTKADGEDGKALILAKDLDEISKVIGDEGSLKVSVYSKYIVTEFDGITLTTYLTYSNEEEFSKFENLIGDINLTKSNTKIKIKRSELINSIERGYILSNSKHGNLIMLDIDNEILTITGKSDIGELCDKIEIYQEGQPLKISFNGKFLTNCLRNISDEYIIIEFISEIQPCIIKPCDGDEYTFVILPVRTM